MRPDPLGRREPRYFISGERMSRGDRRRLETPTEVSRRKDPTSALARVSAECVSPGLARGARHLISMIRSATESAVKGV